MTVTTAQDAAKANPSTIMGPSRGMWGLAWEEHFDWQPRMMFVARRVRIRRALSGSALLARKRALVWRIVGMTAGLRTADIAMYGALPMASRCLGHLCVLALAVVGAPGDPRNTRPTKMPTCGAEAGVATRLLGNAATHSTGTWDYEARGARSPPQRRHCLLVQT
jgi:hypothetical protein